MKTDALLQSEEAAPGHARQLVAKATHEIGDELLRKKLLELIETVILYKLPRLSRQEIQVMLQVDDIRETRVYKDAMKEGAVATEISLIPKLVAEKKSAKQIAAFLELDVKRVRREIKKLES